MIFCSVTSVPLQVVAHEGKQFGTMHLIPYLKHYLMAYHKNSLSIKISTIGVANIFYSGEGGQNANHMQ